MPRKRCPHNKSKQYCKICTPSVYCEHDRIKRRCKACFGIEICIHGIHKYNCKPCKGNGVCVHNKNRSACKVCRGGGVCLHNEIRRQCKECSPKNFCVHGIFTYNCKACAGGRFCMHGRKKYFCKTCLGKGLCSHDKRRGTCTTCLGSQICPHLKRKNRCKTCNGSQVCVHEKDKSNCKACSGSCYCTHNKLKSCCKECGGSALCSIPFCEMRRNKKYKPYCSRCFAFMNPDSPLLLIRNFRTKELAVKDFITTRFPGLTWIYNKTVPDGCSLRRPDLTLDLGSHVLFIEIEENAHDLGYSCTSKRLVELWQDVGERPSLFLRFNPDKYTKENGEKVSSCWKYNPKGLTVLKNEANWNIRLHTLAECITYYLTNIPQKSIQIEQLFFN